MVHDLRVRDVMNPSVVVVVVTAGCTARHVTDVITEFGVSGVSDLRGGPAAPAAPGGRDRGRRDRRRDALMAARIAGTLDGVVAVVDAIRPPVELPSAGRG